ncbi:hypothetical protein [Salimicrobium jeotgali]|nr:hypothetical protein [Salimicrobium jeotgali]
MKRVEELWKRIEYIGNASHFDDDTMTALGSVFGEMKSTIKQQQERIDSITQAQTQLRGDGMERVDYIRFLEKELSHTKNAAFRDIEKSLQASNYLDKPYKSVERKELYNQLTIAAHENESLKEQNRRLTTALESIYSMTLQTDIDINGVFHRYDYRQVAKEALEEDE